MWKDKASAISYLGTVPEQTYDLVKRDRHLTFLTLSPGLEITGKQEYNVTNHSLQPQAEDNIGINCSLYYNSPGASRQQPTLF